MSEDQLTSKVNDGRQEFAYRLLYLRPSDYSDERMAVGLVADGLARIESKFVSAITSLELLERIFGADGVEQYHFSVAEFKRSLNGVKTLDDIVLPSTLLALGEVNHALSADRNGLLLRVLESSSCLMRASGIRNRDVLSSHANSKFVHDIRDSVSKLNPLLADQIFRQKCVLPSGEKIDLPILGRNVFGAPISFAGRVNSFNDQKTKAEAFAARFQVFRKHLRQRPKLYVLAPDQSNAGTRRNMEAHVNELRAVTDATDVSLKIAVSTDELATSVISDEIAVA